MPRFVILRHASDQQSDRPLHWDFMLEDENSLLTWALSSEPSAGKRITAEQLGNHRVSYLDYEGPISGDRGFVRRWDSGSFEWTKRTSEEIVVTLDGQLLRCDAWLRRDTTDQRWVVSFGSSPSMIRR